MSDSTYLSSVTPLDSPERLRVTCPPGRYWVGDPCYSIPNDEWMPWLEAADYTRNSREHVLAAKVGGHIAVGVSTAYGDGEYPDEQGRMYGVDAGLIGVVPVEIAENKYNHDEAGRIIEFDREFDCYYDDGVVVLGPIRIHTGDSYDEWVEDPEYDDED
jgi:hypothetical protein